MTTHNSVNDCGPWYEVQEITSIGVKEILFNSLKIKAPNHNILNIAIEIHVSKYKDFGSYRGYYTFLHNNLCIINIEFR